MLMMTENWSRRADLALAKARQQQPQTQQMSNGLSNGIPNGVGGPLGHQLVDRLCQLLEKEVQQNRALDDELAARRTQKHLRLYGTWTNGAAAGLAARRATNNGFLDVRRDRIGDRLGTRAIDISMESIPEDEVKDGRAAGDGRGGDDEPWRGSCQFSDIMETMDRDERREVGDDQGRPKEEEEAAADDADSEPWQLRALLYAALFACSAAYLLAGAQIFRWLDPHIGSKVFPKALVWTFQLATTIGWGDSKATTGWSQAFTVGYVLFAIPIIFSVFANVGRLITEIACVGWPRMKCWILGREFVREKHAIHRFPLLAALNFLCLHQSVGIFLYSHWLKQWPVMGTVYYSITTMATIGFGDYHPDTDHWGETLVALVYLSTGITLLSMLFLTIAFYFQTMHYEWFRMLLEKAWLMLGRGKKSKKMERKNGSPKEEKRNDGNEGGVQKNVFA